MKHGELPVYDRTDQAIRLIEEERRRIARDLHDGPAQDITNVSMRLEIIQRMLKTNPELAEAELARLNSRVIGIVNSIRRLIYDLRPVAIDEVGLVKAITELCRRLEDDWHVAIDLTVAPDVHDDFAPAKQVAIYRLVQEVFQNIHKHAAASRVQVSLTRSGPELFIRIQDDGKGFDPTSIPAGRYGIAGMRERAAYLGGRLVIQSAPGQGSQFTFGIPVYGEG
ncbi:MAG: sensor histidine kinase [Alicyclobacillus macrosporangiidus]|uniref:sensor histidine kinase n=1 Tax=Alicyclobacillus macrosporangiidus TaxID=392015 RepID=UPI0026EB5891|nr:sensor histidine kinase [Alicyclobacillus macrosporangiidus]MCL6598885.1 sensor histidine kinase [Alicyclobacillus macrosporangiidus]